MSNTQIRSLGGNSGRNRSHNRRVVLEFIHANEPAGRADIARSSGLSTQAVSNICESLVLDGLLREDGFRTGARGKPVMRYRFDGERAFSIGIELRPDALITAVLSLSREQIYASRIDLADASPDHAVPQIQRQVELAMKHIGRDRSHLLGVGVVMPWSFGAADGSSANPAELPGWAGVDVRLTFEDALKCPVVIENDATSAAISERVVGIATEMDTFCFVYFGAGLGLGVISDGHARRGANGKAGEIGHIVTQLDGIPCECGNHGCLEKYASRMSVRDYLAGQGIPLAGSATLEHLLAQRDAHLDRWITLAAENLSRAIGILENLFDPEAVVLGGAMPDALLDEIIKRLALSPGSVANHPARKFDRVLRGSSGRFTAAIGGAALVIHKIITPAPSVS